MGVKFDGSVLWKGSNMPHPILGGPFGLGTNFREGETFKGGDLITGSSVKCTGCERYCSQADKGGWKELQVWVSDWHVICHDCAVWLAHHADVSLAIFRAARLPGGQLGSRTVNVTTGPGLYRCTECSLRRNAEADRWCVECAANAK